MANKPEYVDLIRDATRQRRKTPPAKIIAQPEAPKEERRLSNWPPGRFAKWRLETLVPWRLSVKNWQFKDWL
ncbi:hypothetical protein ACRAVF_09520 [Bradyrhizobium oligotrophicum S58]